MEFQQLYDDPKMIVRQCSKTYNEIECLSMTSYIVLLIITIVYSQVHKLLIMHVKDK